MTGQDTPKKDGVTWELRFRTWTNMWHQKENEGTEKEVYERRSQAQERMEDLMASRRLIHAELFRITEHEGLKRKKRMVTVDFNRKGEMTNFQSERE
jgi:hypothetical protein